MSERNSSIVTSVPEGGYFNVLKSCQLGRREGISAGGVFEQTFCRQDGRNS